MLFDIRIITWHRSHGQTYQKVQVKLILKLKLKSSQQYLCSWYAIYFECQLNALFGKCYNESSVENQLYQPHSVRLALYPQNYQTLLRVDAL